MGNISPHVHPEQPDGITLPSSENTLTTFHLKKILGFFVSRKQARNKVVGTKMPTVYIKFTEVLIKDQLCFVADEKKNTHV